MGIINTSIRIDQDVKDYAKIAARRSDFTFMAYYEDLILKDIKENHPDLYENYISGHPAAEAKKEVRKRSILANVYDPDMKLIDEFGEIIVQNKPIKAQRPEPKTEDNDDDDGLVAEVF